jgi:hypothetical protein
MEEDAMGLLIVILCRQIVVPSEVFSPLNWWVDHEHQFPKISSPI